MKRVRKTLAAIALMSIVLGGANLLIRQPTPSATVATVGPSGSATPNGLASPSGWSASSSQKTTQAEPSRQVAGIVYLDAHGLPAHTIGNLKDMGATEVYLYVAYHTDAYFRIPANPYGLAQPADTLRGALSELHKNGFRVVAVISSALLDPRLVTAAGRSLLQPNSGIIDPVQSSAFLAALVKNLSSYNVDGVYVGEPYYTQGVANPSGARQADWTRLYSTLMDITRRAGKPMLMVLPDLYASGVTVQNVSGLPESLTALPFQSIGIDLEDAYQGYAADITRYENAVIKAKSISGNRPTIIEVSLRRGDFKTPVPSDFFRREVEIAAQYHVQTLLIFANEWWNELPTRERSAYKSALRGYLES